MRAVRYHQYGPPEVLVVEDAPEPQAGPGEVRVRVSATSVNAIDWKLRAGHLRAVPLEMPAIPGRDAAGVVDQVGAGVSGVAVGDEVFGLGGNVGAAAELAVLSAWAPVPAAWSHEQAAAAGLASATAEVALDVLAAAGGLHGATVLVEGAGGGVGSALVELARARGARVIGTSSSSGHAFLAELGAEATTYGEGLAERVAVMAPGGVDAVVDAAGSGSLAQLVAIVGSPDRVVSVADAAAGALGVQLLFADNDSQALARVAALGGRGAYTPRVAQVVPMEDLAAAHAEAERGRTRGKVAVSVG